MDPYLEARWADVHAALITSIREALQPLLPRDLRARAEERVLLETAAGDVEGSYRSDVAVVGVSGTQPPRPVMAGSSTIEPVVIAVHDEPLVERWVQIIDTSSGNAVVTAIEVLSPWNKAPGRLNASYRRKLADYRRGGVSVVEVDLLRHPPRGRLEVRTEDLPAHRRSAYLVCVRRQWEPSQWLAYPLSLRDRLPVIPIPLRRTDADVTLDLQPLIDRVYEGGGHDDIDYTRPPDPPLAETDAAWATELVARARRQP